MTARRVLIPAALLSVVVSVPALAQDPAPEAAAPPAAVARVNRRAAPADDGPRRSEAVRAPEIRVRERVAESSPSPATPPAAALDEQGGRRRPSGGGGGRASGGGSPSGGAVPRGGVRNPDSGSRGGSSRAQAVPRSQPRGGWGPSTAWRGSGVGRRYYGAPAGFGYYLYDPWSWYGWGWPAYGAYAGWGWGGYYGNAWGGYGGYYGGYGGYGGGYGWTGGVRLKVDHRDAEVYVDGYYAGAVDDFDGTFQQLRLDDGGYRIEIRKPGFETLVFDVRVQPGRTITYRGRMTPAP